MDKPYTKWTSKQIAIIVLARKHQVPFKQIALYLNKCSKATQNIFYKYNADKFSTWRVILIKDNIDKLSLKSSIFIEKINTCDGLARTKKKKKQVVRAPKLNMWTTMELASACYLYDEKQKSLAYIAGLLNRSVGSVKVRIAKHYRNDASTMFVVETNRLINSFIKGDKEPMSYTPLTPREDTYAISYDDNQVKHTVRTEQEIMNLISTSIIPFKIFKLVEVELRDVKVIERKLVVI